jgi:hypothetical protein
VLQQSSVGPWDAFSAASLPTIRMMSNLRALKGQCHEMNILFKILKIETVLFEMSAYGFHNFKFFFLKEIKIKDSASFYEITY